MTLIRFPHRLDELQTLLACASCSRENWSLVTQAIDEMFPGARARLRRLSTDRRDGLERAPPQSPPRQHGSVRDPGLPDATADLAPGTLFDIPRPGASAPSVPNLPGWMTGLVLHRRAPWTWVLTAEGPDQLKERHAAAAHSLLRRHGDALRRAFLVSHCLGTPDQPGRSVIEASWDPLPFGIALVARNRTILAANTAADDLLSTQRFFVPPGETRILRAAGLKDRLRLARAIDRILGGESDREATLVEGLRQGEPLPVTLLPCDGKDGLASPPGATPSRRDSLLAIIGDSGESFCARRDIA